MSQQYGTPPDSLAQQLAVGFEEGGALSRGANRRRPRGASWPCVAQRAVANPAGARTRLSQWGACHVRGGGDTPLPQPGLGKRHNWPRTREWAKRPKTPSARMPRLFSYQQSCPTSRLRQGHWLAPSARNTVTGGTRFIPATGNIEISKPSIPNAAGGRTGPPW